MCFLSQYKSTIYIMVPLPTLCFKMYLTVFVLDIVFGLYNNISTVECNNRVISQIAVSIISNDLSDNN